MLGLVPIAQPAAEGLRILQLTPQTGWSSAACSPSDFQVNGGDCTASSALVLGLFDKPAKLRESDFARPHVERPGQLYRVPRGGSTAAELVELSGAWISISPGQR